MRRTLLLNAARNRTDDLAVPRIFALDSSHPRAKATRYRRCRWKRLPCADDIAFSLSARWILGAAQLCVGETVVDLIFRLVLRSRAIKRRRGGTGETKIKIEMSKRRGSSHT